MWLIGDDDPTPHTVSMPPEPLETSPTDEQQLQPTDDAGLTPKHVAVPPVHLETPTASPIEKKVL